MALQSTPNHTQTVSGWAAHDSSGKIVLTSSNEVLYCGICHTDLHHVKNDWGITMYPVVPGHEITGVITKVGSNVKKFKIGNRVGVGCLVASCLECEFCMNSQENYCDQIQFTYNGIFWDGSITYGGYSTMLVADHRYVVNVPDNLPMDAAAPLLCAGITAFGHHVTVISTSLSKEIEAKQRLGADCFIVSTNDEQMQSGKRTLDVILDTANGAPFFSINIRERAVKGSMTGSMKETQEMLDVCGKHNITCDVELIKPDQINQALDRLARNDVRYRFVIDISGNSKH
ncbi:putative cinnamyl alcohol dehydrogenase 6 [Hibiscus syriacus]|uniref:cinnamyl-alcohol dehydrogenase n=1 Tax=Hibiscus syriacus TaxID=106335 RepID=A0A6A2XDE7_HIBSY|nr:putative cinnamyl alcohol dehydrogenase 6 [Hibiscus syriacus]